jgi:hypothetical protein
VLPPPPALPTWAAGPPAPPPPPPTGTPIDLDLDLGSLVPATPRESAIIEARAKASNVGFDTPREEAPRRVSRRSVARPALPQPGRSHGLLWFVMFLAVAGAAGWLVYSGRVQVPALDGLLGRRSPTTDSVRASGPARGSAPRAGGAGGAATPEPARPAPVISLIPAVLIGGLPMDTVLELAGVDDGFRVFHRDSAGVIELISRPARAGDPAPGQPLLDVLPGDTGSATGTFEGFAVTLRAPRDPQVLGELLKRLILVPRN